LRQETFTKTPLSGKRLKFLLALGVKKKMVKLKEIALFILITLTISIPLYYLTLTGYSYGTTDKWILIALNVVFLALFLLFLPFKKKVARLPNSVYLAFILALYVEMYGIPLTMFLFAGFFGQNNIFSLEFLLTGLVGQETFYRVFNTYIFPLSKIIMGIGILLIIYGWRAIYKGRKEGKLVTTGLYGVIRNPQYVGFLLITLGLNVMWLTIITLILWPILAVLYWRLSKREDKDMEEKFGQEFIDYKNRVPGFLPRLRKRTAS
jgi:protein-S-isoprenylcysteine O-methyltransferase Ste14